MNFLAPLFLIGGIALALPVIFHLIRRITREKTVFSSLLFLEPTPPRLTRRSRIENWLLLLLRCLVLALLALGFARPFLKDRAAPPEPEGAAQRTVLLLDASASMRRPDLWSDAVSRAAAILREARPGDEFAISVFSRDVRSLLRFDEWKSASAGDRSALALARLKDVSPDGAGTFLGPGLVRAAEQLAEADATEAAGRRRIVVFSDFQEGSHTEVLQGYEWPKDVQVQLEPIKVKNPGNAGLQLVAEAASQESSTNPVVRVRVVNSPDAAKDRFQVGWLAPAAATGFAGTPLEVYVPAGQSRIVAVPVPKGIEGLNRIGLTGDGADFDNTVAVIPPEAVRTRVLYLGADRETETRQPLYFLKRAFPPTRRQMVDVVTASGDGALAPEFITGAALTIVTDPLPDERARQLREAMQAGATVLAAPKAVGVAATLGRLTGVEGLAVSESATGRYAILSELDFRHPLLGIFADPRFSDFSRIHFWKHRRLDAASIPGARVVARFDGGDPALLEVPAGRGRLLLLTSGWHPEDSQLALTTKFVPLLYSMLELAGGMAAPPSQYSVGDTVPLPLDPSNTARVVLDPDGVAVPLPAGATNFTATTKPGIYTLKDSTPLVRFGVNLEPGESRTAPMALDDLERLGAPIVQPAGRSEAAEKARQALLQSTEAEARQKLWRWFLIGALALLLVETFLAGWTARRTTVPEGVTT